MSSDYPEPEETDASPGGAVVETGPTSISQTIRMPKGQGIGARATWTVRDIIIGIVMAIVSVILLQIAIVGPFLAEYGEDDPVTQGAASAATLAWNVSLVFIVYFLAKRRGGGWRSLGWRELWHNETWSMGRIVGTVIGGYVCMWGVLAIYNVIINLLGLEALMPDEQIPAEIFDHVWLVVLMGVAVIVGAPISEELFFRGFFYGGLRRRMGVIPPALLTGALFSLAHLQLGLILPFTMIGAILSIVYERTGSIRMNMALHIVFNTISFMILVLVPDARGS